MRRAMAGTACQHMGSHCQHMGSHSGRSSRHSGRRLPSHRHSQPSGRSSRHSRRLQPLRRRSFIRSEQHIHRQLQHLHRLPVFPPQRQPRKYDSRRSRPAVVSLASRRHRTTAVSPGVLGTPRLVWRGADIMRRTSPASPYIVSQAAECDGVACIHALALFAVVTESGSGHVSRFLFR